MSRGLKISIILHLGFFLLLFFGLPIFNSKHDYEQQVVTVEILPISEITNVKAKKLQSENDNKKAPTTEKKPVNKTPQKTIPNPPKPIEKAIEKPAQNPIPYVHHFFVFGFLNW